MLYVKGQSGNRAGKPKGIKNNPDLNSLRKLLEESFSENRPWIKECISQMLNGMRKQLIKINEQLDQELDNKQVSELSRQRYFLLGEFKWLMELKAQMEPRELKADVNVSYTAEDLLERFDIASVSAKN